MKRTELFIFQSILIVFTSMMLTACPTTQVGPDDVDADAVGDNPADGSSAGFLKNNQARLNEFLDSPKSVEWRYMRLPGLFDYSPVNKLNYEFESLPQTDEMFELQDENITPRELLRKVAEFYDLEMSVEPGNYVLVKGRE